MRDELLAYLLNDLDEEQRGRIESRIKSDPIWQHELKRLRSYIEAAPSLDDDSFTTALEAEETLPVDLVNRTCSFVQQASSQGELSPAVLPPTLSESQDSVSSKSKRWSLVDLGVAASILLMLGTLLLPAIQESRAAARRAQCKSNLYAIGKALVRFSDQSNGQIPTIGRNENAGMYAVKLVERGILTREQIIRLLVCPSTQLADDVYNGVITIRIPTRQELATATDKDLAPLLENMGGSFAYRVGYLSQQEDGQPIMYRQIPFTRNSQIPMMADKPSNEIHAYQSANHGGCGQNVLFEDLSIRYVTVCIEQGHDRNWYVNIYGQPGAGTNPEDVVLLRSESFPLRAVIAQ